MLILRGQKVDTEHVGYRDTLASHFLFPNTRGCPFQQVCAVFSIPILSSLTILFLASSLLPTLKVESIIIVALDLLLVISHVLLLPFATPTKMNEDSAAASPLLMHKRRID